VTKEADKKRRKAIRELRTTGPSIARKTFNLDENVTSIQIKHRIAKAYNNPRRDLTDVKMLDFTMKQTVGKYTEKINK
jgi:hypothetical protein